MELLKSLISLKEANTNTKLKSMQGAPSSKMKIFDDM
jgi:hypothetical protein